jgi:predicted nucleic acid-binding Zn ribbon protein
MSDDPLTVCPICEGHIRRIVNSVGVVFKGSGFYVNDARSTNGSKNGAAKSTESSSSTASQNTTTEKTPAPSTSKETAATATSE